MSDDKTNETNETKQKQKGATKRDEIEDLTNAEVSGKNADEVKGGRILNFPFETGKGT